jgi:hypothetical protein
MIRAGRVCVFVVAAGIVAIACASFSSGDDGSTAPDSGVDGQTGVVDAPGPSDGDADAAPAQPFCKPDSGSTFCDDFDDPQRAVWSSSVPTTNGGAVGVTNVHFVSPPSSLHVTMPVPLPDAGGSFAFRFAYIDAPIKDGFHFEAKIFPAALGAQEFTLGFELFTNTVGDAGECGYIVREATTQSTFYQASPVKFTNAPPLSYKLVAGRWNAVSVDLGGAAGSTQTVSVTIDGKNAGTVAVLPECQGPPQFDLLSVGLIQVPGDYPDTIEGWIDDVRLDLH